jgi:hypothetical protein
LAYSNRSFAYYRLGETSKAKVDLKKACDFGDQSACDMLNNL